MIKAKDFNSPSRTEYYFYPTNGVVLDEKACLEISLVLKQENDTDIVGK